jgi:hypothetical protein
MNESVTGITPSGSNVATLFATGKYLQAANVYNYSNTVWNNVLYYTLTTPISGPPYTISFWFKLNTNWVSVSATQPVPYYSGIIRAQNAFICNARGQSASSIGINYGLYDSSGTQVSGSDTGNILDLTNWVFICGVVTSSTYTLYIQKENSTTQLVKTLTPTSGNSFNQGFSAIGSLYGGSPGAAAGTTPPFDGLIDDLRIYNTALTAVQVQSVYTQGGAPASQFRVMPQPTYAWTFDGTTTDYVSGLAPANYLGASANAITYANAAIYAPGKYGQSINVYNTSNTFYLNTLQYRLPSSIGPPYSISFWAKQNTIWVPGNGTFQSLLLRNISSPVNSFVFKLPSYSVGNSTLAISVLDVNNNALNSFTQYLTGGTGNWFFVCISVSSQSATLYFWSPSYSSIQTSTVTTSNTYVPCGTDIATAISGYTETNTTNQPFNGLLDDLRVYNTALSAAQVQEIYQEQGVPGRGFSTPYLPSPAGYDYVPFSSLPSSFTLTQTSTGNVWTINTGSTQIRDGNWGSDPTLTLTPSQPSDIYSVRNPGIWYRLFGGGNYVRHAGFVMFTQGYAAGNFDFAWAFFLKQGTTNQVKIWNPYPGNGTGYWVQSGINTAGRIAISTTDPNQAHIYTISSPISGASKLTGAPLFSQLSASAASSAVGAFSLRAVNGVTTKAVNVRAGNVILPPSFNSSATSIGSNSYSQSLTSNYLFGGSGTYIATGSSIYGPSSTQPWKAFDNDTRTWWETTANIYDKNGNGGVYLGSQTITIGGVATLCEWLKIQMPTGIVLSSYSMYARSGFEYRMPRNFVIAGSNDGTTWTAIDTQTNQTSWTGQTPITFNVTSSTVYTYFALCVTAIVGAGGLQNLNIGQWTLNGSNASWNTDFYADPLGNLLTAPVTGTTLANWLGGATGYVTTWYDQSGKGNHATQSTAANQPVIQKATKGPGYSALFNGTNSTLVAPTSSNVFDLTNYTVSAVTRRGSTAATQYYYTGSANGSTGTNGLVAFGYLNSGTQLVIDKRNNVAFGPTVPGYAAGTEPVGYDYYTFSQTTGVGIKIYSWRSGAAYTQTQTTVVTPQNLSGSAIVIGTGQGTAYFTGEIMEIMIFQTSLFETGGDASINQIYQNQLSYTGT